MAFQGDDRDYVVHRIDPLGCNGKWSLSQPDYSPQGDGQHLVLTRHANDIRACVAGVGGRIGEKHYAVPKGLGIARVTQDSSISLEVVLKDIVGRLIGL